jgi:hypothetical protein
LFRIRRKLEQLLHNHHKHCHIHRSSNNRSDDSDHDGSNCHNRHKLEQQCHKRRNHRLLEQQAKQLR